MGRRGHAVVVGGGIGGLSAAIGLRRIGWRVTVLERSPRFSEIGAGLTLWPNALRALRELGLGAPFEDAIAKQGPGGARAANGRRLSSWDGPGRAEALGGPVLGVHRGDLHQLLADALPATTFRFGAQVQDVSNATAPAIAGHEDLGDIDVLIGADGMNSRVRRQLWPQHPQPAYSGWTAWRGVSSPAEDVEMTVSIGRGAEFGTIPLGDGRVCWYAAELAPAGRRFADEKSTVQNRFADWHAPIPSVIAATPAREVLHHDIAFLGRPLSSYVRGRVALLGDAAHAMTPHLGQGACQAIEDAVVLASVLSRVTDVEDPQAVTTALADYDRLRLPRTQAVARASRALGRFGMGIRNPAVAALRDTAMSLVPNRLSLRSMGRFASWTPPRVPDRATD
ncbi:FAD-dependent monooxygenase [Actinoalloteichus hymeniacidonis]|uniref:2-polyprenyl-6-methoxyphenol hydroxylase-like oxidoreductase n=1 Tax=Actinoalloteichus hymeniacidonis TaxID=340345 RepID=A0AAC9HT49_9PSEU|nr:FAD-dependent monooxygenase [Actinoalloteichus hymeniacidonis]AOS64983.1 2-polyprenyl-6-methoxyphenol hydroxylase-like oxidoreductase [Actinoalloteichus hymeniacidonis]MBB5906942.1 2-polyprenyl-6-methoxyphenol hydroxylase-like FAD-dependent oxidoreductase [Actinoalloteichus hymeniacidonis]